MLRRQSAGRRPRAVSITALIRSTQSLGLLQPDAKDWASLSSKRAMVPEDQEERRSVSFLPFPAVAMTNSGVDGGGDYTSLSISAVHGNCQETKTCMVRACHSPRQPLQNHPSRHLGGSATLWSGEKMLDEQHQRVNISTHARTVHKGLLQRRLKEDLCRIVPRVPLTSQPVESLN